MKIGRKMNQAKVDEITIRRSRCGDVDVIMEVYDKARRYMRANGNLTQWINGYPSREQVLNDIDRGVGFVGEDGTGEIVMAFAFIIGDDPTYAVIEGGHWLDTSPYGTIHRLGSSGRYKGVLKVCVDFCRKHIDNIRLDTHADNSTMLKATERLGFTRCGIIYCEDGSPRVAFQQIFRP